MFRRFRRRSTPNRQNKCKSETSTKTTGKMKLLRTKSSIGAGIGGKVFLSGSHGHLNKALEGKLSEGNGSNSVSSSNSGFQNRFSFPSLTRRQSENKILLRTNYGSNKVQNPLFGTARKVPEDEWDNDSYCSEQSSESTTSRNESLPSSCSVNTAYRRAHQAYDYETDSYVSVHSFSSVDLEEPCDTMFGDFDFSSTERHSFGNRKHSFHSNYSRYPSTLSISDVETSSESDIRALAPLVAPSSSGDEEPLWLTDVETSSGSNCSALSALAAPSSYLNNDEELEMRLRAIGYLRRQRMQSISSLV